MNTVKNNKTFLFFILFFISCLIITSCEKKIKEEKCIAETKVQPRIEAQVLIEIAESNLKVAAISQKAQDREMQNSTRAVFQKIENDHVILKNKIKKIAKDNFIIIPNVLYETEPLKSLISEANVYLYLKKTGDLLAAELEYYRKINETTQNKTLKILATENITIIKDNLIILQKEQNSLK